MDTKTCPSCGADVPTVATRCRHCFHDFAEASTRKGNGGGMLLVLGAIAIIAVLGGGTFWFLAQTPTDTRILVDGTSKTVQWVQQYQDGRLETERVAFADIRTVELAVSRTGTSEIAVITADGARHVVESQRNQNLVLKAEEYAEIIGLPLVVKDDNKLSVDGK